MNSAHMSPTLPSDPCDSHLHVPCGAEPRMATGDIADAMTTWMEDNASLSRLVAG